MINYSTMQNVNETLKPIIVIKIHQMNIFNTKYKGSFYILYMFMFFVFVRGRQLWEQLQKKAELYRTGVILVPHGDDFRYSSPSEWYKQMNNLEKLMKYINSRPYMQTQVHG